MKRAGLRVHPERCGPASGWDLQNAHESREVEVSVLDCVAFDLRLVLRESDYPGTSRDDLAAQAVRMAEKVGPALLAALRAEHPEVRR